VALKFCPLYFALAKVAVEPVVPWIQTNDKVPYVPNHPPHSKKTPAPQGASAMPLLSAGISLLLAVPMRIQHLPGLHA
jgi:hypothetical protein